MQMLGVFSEVEFSFELNKIDLVYYVVRFKDRDLRLKVFSLHCSFDSLFFVIYLKIID